MKVSEEPFSLIRCRVKGEKGKISREHGKICPFTPWGVPFWKKSAFFSGGCQAVAGLGKPIALGVQFFYGARYVMVLSATALDGQVTSLWVMEKTGWVWPAWAQYCQWGGNMVFLPCYKE